MRTHLREMTPADVPAVQEKLREQNERDGTSYTMPQVFASNGSRLPNIPLALVAVSEDGEVIQGHVFEATGVEQTTYGIDPEATVCSMHEQSAVMYLLRQRGFDHLSIFVPLKRAPDMQHGLEKIYGMTCLDKHFKTFYRMTDPAENAEFKKFYEREVVNV